MRLLERFEEDGFYVLQGVLGVYVVERLRAIAEAAILHERAVYMERGLNPPCGRVFSCLDYGEEFLQLFLNDDFYEGLTRPLDEPHPVLHVYTTSSIPPGGTNVFRDMHVDSRLDYGRFLEGVGCVVMLDDFTADNGATQVLPGSHLSSGKPDEPDFDRGAVHVTGRAGDVLVFHPRLWHRSGDNMTRTWRHSLSIGISRPWICPYVDHYRILEAKGALPREPRLFQLIGGHARPFRSADDYYRRVNHDR